MIYSNWHGAWLSLQKHYPGITKWIQMINYGWFTEIGSYFHIKTDRVETVIHLCEDLRPTELAHRRLPHLEAHASGIHLCDVNSLHYKPLLTLWVSARQDSLPWAVNLGYTAWEMFGSSCFLSRHNIRWTDGCAPFSVGVNWPLRSRWTEDAERRKSWVHQSTSEGLLIKTHLCQESRHLLIVKR